MNYNPFAFGYTNKTNIINVYIPPSSSSPPGYTPNLGHLDTLPHTYILGDPNAHDPAWLETQTTDTRGLHITQQLASMQIFNTFFFPTRKPYNTNTQPTFPDVSLATRNLALRSTWIRGHDFTSDHLPIYITHTLLTPHSRRPNKTFTNYKQADWISFSAYIENELQTYEIESTIT